MPGTRTTVTGASLLTWHAEYRYHQNQQTAKTAAVTAAAGAAAAAATAALTSRDVGNVIYRGVAVLKCRRLCSHVTLDRPGLLLLSSILKRSTWGRNSRCASIGESSQDASISVLQEKFRDEIHLGSVRHSEKAASSTASAVAALAPSAAATAVASAAGESSKDGSISKLKKTLRPQTTPHMGQHQWRHLQQVQHPEHPQERSRSQDVLMGQLHWEGMENAERKSIRKNAQEVKMCYGQWHREDMENARWKKLQAAVGILPMTTK
jgi:hypothetical protein